MEQIQVLMSTYNGEKYLKVQLDSLLKQTWQNVQILIRDDGSTDRTVEILEKYAKEHENISFYAGSNLGVIQSFFHLLRHSSQEAEYYAFADQDDYWMPEKLERAVTMLREQTEIAQQKHAAATQQERAVIMPREKAVTAQPEKLDRQEVRAQSSQLPLLYCSDTYITDENLNIIKKDDKNPRPSFGNALVQNICTGCTAVINRALCSVIRQTVPEHIVMHDWWLYLTAEIYGQVCYDKNAYIKYRQHGKNAFGEKKNKLEVWRYRLGQLTAKRGNIYPQLEEVKKWYPDMDAEKMQLLECVLGAKKGLRGKLALICDKRIYRNSREDDLVYRGIVMLGKL